MATSPMLFPVPQIASQPFVLTSVPSGPITCETSSASKGGKNVYNIATGLKGLRVFLTKVCIPIKWLQHELYFHELFQEFRERGNHCRLSIWEDFMEEACGCSWMLYNK